MITLTPGNSAKYFCVLHLKLMIVERMLLFECYFLVLQGMSNVFDGAIQRDFIADKAAESIASIAVARLGQFISFECYWLALLTHSFPLTFFLDLFPIMPIDFHITHFILEKIDVASHDQE